MNKTLADFGKPEDFELSLPYGKIVGMKWGPETGRPFIALHGWLDNLASFFPLIQYLPDTIHLVAIDIVGHGHSSHLPIGAKYSRLQMVVDFRRVIELLQWKRFSLIGHSLGGILATLYASCFPEEVEELVLLDTAYPGVTLMRELSLAESVMSFLEMEVKDLHSYSIEEAYHRFTKDRYGFTFQRKEYIDALILRATKKAENDKLVFRRDLRTILLPCLLDEVRTEEQFFEIVGNIVCKLLIIVGKGKSLTKFNPELERKTIDIWSANLGDKFRFAEVEGDHYPHLKNPEEIARLITDFVF